MVKPVTATALPMRVPGVALSKVTSELTLVNPMSVAGTSRPSSDSSWSLPMAENGLGRPEAGLRARKNMSSPKTMENEDEAANWAVTAPRRVAVE